MAVKRRDPCTKRRGDLRLSRLAPVSALEQSWTARAGPSAQRHGRSLTPAVGTARLAAPLRRRERGEAKKKKERESKTAPPPPPGRKGFALSNRRYSHAGPGVSVSRTDWSHGRVGRRAASGSGIQWGRRGETGPGIPLLFEFLWAKRLRKPCLATPLLLCGEFVPVRSARHGA